MPISSAGIGYLISRYRTIRNSPHIFAGVLLAMGIAFNALIRLIERRAAVWQVGTRAGRDAMAPSAVGQAA
jgi:NitT/TauT family transport system permease protein